MEENEENYDVQSEQTGSYYYLRFYDHMFNCIKNHLIAFLVTSIATFGISWTFIEAISYLLNLNLSDSKILFGCVIVVSIIFGTGKSVYNYLNKPPKGLENESNLAQRVAIQKRPFWEFKLAFVILSDRLSEIDEKLDNLLSGRTHIKVIKSLSNEEYSNWLSLRPTNLLNMVEVAKNLLVFELSSCIAGEKTGKLEINSLIKLADQIKDVYEATYQFVIEGKEITVPDGFETLHEIQSEWVNVIRDGFTQMLDVLDKISKRKAKDKDQINESIVFEEPPRISEFEQELERLEIELLHKDF